MYDLNEVNCGPGPEYGKLTVTQENYGAVPKTPEIINSLIAISPLEEYMGKRGIHEYESFSGDTCSSTSSNVDSPTSPVTVKNMRSQLIKAEVKIRLQKKQQKNISTNEEDSVCQNQQPTRSSWLGCDESSMDTEEDDGNSLYGDVNYTNLGLTPEDEERRRRRRERNKIAATKCRMKKRERTANLVNESKELENQNHDLKTQIQELEGQKRSLVDMLNVHKPTCVKPSPEQSPVLDFQQPPSFIPNCVSNSSFVENPNRERIPGNDNSILSDFCRIDSSGFQESYVKNPSVMLSACDNIYSNGEHKNKKNTHLSRQILNANYKSNVPNFSFLDDVNLNHYDTTGFMDNSENGCLV